MPAAGLPTLISATTVPLSNDLDLDLDALPRAMAGLRALGLSAVFTPGTTGEFTTLTREERTAVIDAALDEFGPDGVLAHVGGACLRDALANAEEAVAAGARRLSAITPYFVPAGPASVRDYYEGLAQAFPQADIWVYLFSRNSATHVSPAQLAELAQVPGIAGAKISGLPTDEALAYVRAVPAGFPVYTGNDREYLRFVRGGGTGVVSGVAAVFPAPFLAAQELLHSVTDADACAGPHMPAPVDEQIACVQQRLDRAVDLTCQGDFAMLKAGAAMRGLPAGPLRLAVDPPSAPALEHMRAAIESAEPVS